MKMSGKITQAVTAQINTEKAIFLNLGEAMMDGPSIDPAYPSPSTGSIISPERPGEKDAEGKNKEDGVGQEEGEIGPAAEAPETAAGRGDAPGEGEGDEPDEPCEQERDEQGARTNEDSDDKEGAAQDLHPREDHGDDDTQAGRDPLVVLDALGKTEGVGDLQHSGPDKDTANDEPEEKKQPPVTHDGDLSSGSPAALHSATPRAKIRMSLYPLSWMIVAKEMLVWQSPPSQ